MKIIRIILSILGCLLVLLGLVWIGQGCCYFSYPAESFMINQTAWIYWGIILAVAGLVVLTGSRRLGK